VNTFFQDFDDFYVVRVEEHKEQPLPLAAALPDILTFLSLNKYSFYESGDMWVKVQVSLPGPITAHQFQAEFGEKSFIVKITDLGGKNYQFSVPRLQCSIVPDKCRCRVAGDKLSVSLRKVKSTDNWFSLYKAKTIGGDDD
jgi:hypothetical protein